MEKVTKAAHKELVEKLISQSIPVETTQFHGSAGLPGAIADSTTWSKAKVPGAVMHYHPSGILIVQMKSKTWVMPTAGIKSIELK